MWGVSSQVVRSPQSDNHEMSHYLMKCCRLGVGRTRVIAPNFHVCVFTKPEENEYGRDVTIMTWASWRKKGSEGAAGSLQAFSKFDLAVESVGRWISCGGGCQCANEQIFRATSYLHLLNSFDWQSKESVAASMSHTALLGSMSQAD
jgi:hypothetical protein